MCDDRARWAGCTCNNAHLQGIRSGSKASRTASAPLRLQRSGELPDHAVLDIEPVELLFSLGIEGGLGGYRRLSPLGRARLGLAIHLVAHIAREGGRRRVTELVAVRGYSPRTDTFDLTTLFPEGGTP